MNEINTLQIELIDKFTKYVFIHVRIGSQEFANHCFVQSGRCLQEFYNGLNVSFVVLFWVRDELIRSEELDAILELEVEFLGGLA